MFERKIGVVAVAVLAGVIGTPAFAAARGCQPCVPFGTFPGRTPASEILFKKIVSDYYTSEQKPGRPVSVVFERFQVGEPERNRVTTVPGVGATRVNDAAPPGAMLYPVRAIAVTCVNGVVSGGRYRHKDGFECFVSRFGEWVCGGTGREALVLTETIETWNN